MAWPTWVGESLADGAAGSLLVLAAGSLAARLCRQPVRRARLVMLTLLGALIVPGLGALPVAPRWSARVLPPRPGVGREPPAPVAPEAVRPAVAEARPPLAATSESFGVGGPPAARPAAIQPGAARPDVSARPAATPLAPGRGRRVWLGGGWTAGLVAVRSGGAPAAGADRAAGARAGPRGSTRSAGRRGATSSCWRAAGSPCLSPSPGAGR